MASDLLLLLLLLLGLRLRLRVGRRGLAELQCRGERLAGRVVGAGDGTETCVPEVLRVRADLLPERGTLWSKCRRRTCSGEGPSIVAGVLREGCHSLEASGGEWRREAGRLDLRTREGLVGAYGLLSASEHEKRVCSPGSRRFSRGRASDCR